MKNGSHPKKKKRRVMTRTDKAIIGVIVFMLVSLSIIQIGIYQGRKLEREEIKRENQRTINYFNDRIQKLQNEVEEKGKLLQKKKGVFIATAYCNSPVCINVPKWRDGKTATGTDARIGVIAVDPAVIPLGSTVYIKGMGYFKAEDTGGAIRGNRIDIFMGDYKKAKEFGRKKVEVIIL